MELIFYYHNYSKEKKVKLVATVFNDYDIVWWDHVTLSRRRNKERLIDEMMKVMRRHFIPSHYYREFYQHLQNLTQGSKSVEDYHKEMEITMIKANIKETKKPPWQDF